MQSKKVYFALTAQNNIEHYFKKSINFLLLLGFISNFIFNKIYFMTIEGVIIGRVLNSFKTSLNVTFFYPFLKWLP